MTGRTEVSTHIDAPADRVWALVSDLTRMGEWSPETTKVAWRKGASGPAVGARFRGWNRKGLVRWFTDGVVSDLEPGRALAFEVSSAGVPVARWGYRIEPDAGGAGCTLTETWEDHRKGVFKTVTGIAIGVRDRKAHNAEGMEVTLARIKDAAERS